MLTEEQLLNSFKESLYEKLNNDDEILKEIIYRHFNEYCHISPSLTDKNELGLSNEKLDIVLNYINNNIRLNISLKDLSNEVNLSEFHFSRLFKKKTNKSPLQYVNEKRIEMAKGFLLSKNKSITWISYELGYKSSSYFSNKFKELTGLSPTEYRKKMDI